MAQDLPYVGVTLSPNIKPNTDWYLRSVTKSTANTPTTTVPASLFTDIGGRTYSFTTRYGRTYELGRIESGEAQLAVDNTDGLFDPLNTSGALYPNVVPYRPLNIHCAYPRTGNILNDGNLVPAWSANAPTPLSAYRISVGKNDGDFELGAISNWYVTTGTAPTVTTTAHSGTYAMSCANATTVLLDVPVVAGQVVTVSIWYRFSGATTTGSLNLYDGGWTTSSATATATAALSNTTTYTRVSATYTAASPKLTVGLTNTGGAAALYVDDVQVEFGSSATTNVTTGPTFYGLFNGFIERYPQTYQAPNRGQVNMVATDALASMSQNVMASPYASKVIQSGALYYYPFGESSGATAAQNNSAYQQAPMTKFISGTTDYGVTFGDTSAQSGVPGSGTTGVVLKATTDADVKQWTGLVNDSVNDVVIRTNNPQIYTYSFWYKVGDAGAAGRTFTIFQTSNSTNRVLDSGTGVGQLLSVYLLTGESVIYATLADGKGVNANATSNTASTANTSGWHFVSVYAGYVAGSWTVGISLDGGTYGTGTSASTVTEIDFTSINLAGIDTTNGTVFSNLTIHRGSIDQSSYYAVGSSGYLGDSTGQRFSDSISTISGFTYQPTDAQYGNSFMQVAMTSSTALADYIQTIADTEGGEWYVDTDGFAVFKDRHNRLTKLTPSVTFGDGAGEIPYQGGELVINYDPTYVLNDITVSRLNGATVAVQDSTSVATYFPRSYTRQSQSQADSDVTDQAFFLLSRYKDPHARPETITLTPARNPAAFPAALGTNIGDLVRVKKRPLGAPPITIDCFVERIEHSFDAQSGDWITHVTLSPTIVYYWNLAALTTSTSGSAVSGSYVFVTTGAGGRLTAATDLIPGQMLQYTSSGTTYVDVVSGVPSYAGASTVSVPAVRVGTFTTGANTIYTSTLAADIKMDYTGTVTLSDSALSGKGLTTFLIDTEMVTGSVSGTTLTITARMANSTNQTVEGSSGAYTASHLRGATVIGVAGTAGGNVATGTTVTEVLPNQLVRLPYSVPDYTQWSPGTSKIGSWTGSLASGTYTTTTPASSIKYNGFTMNALTDYNNFPSQNLAVGQTVVFSGSGTAELGAIANLGTPATTTNQWVATVYKVVDSGQYLNAAITPDGTTVTCSAAVTASAILIGMEFMQVTAGSGTTTLTVTRGTPDAAVWAVLNKSKHNLYDRIYTVVNAGMTSTHAANDVVFEGYSPTDSVKTGTARLAF